MNELFPESPRAVSGFNAHDKTDGKEEWLTPPEIIRALGEFDLDPCSPTPETRPWPTAREHYDIRDNGLIKPWIGRVWCNPPYGGETGKWMARCAAHGNVTALIFARTETQQFFESIWPSAKAICFIKGRLSFYHITGKKGGAAGAPSMLVTWDDYNANTLWQAVMNGKIRGAYIDLRDDSKPAIREAAQIICQMVDADPKAYEKIHKQTGIHWNVLANLERVGRGAMHYKLLFDSSPAAKYIAALPASQQSQVYEKGVQVLETHDGKTTIETKKAQELTPQQARVVFGEKHIRTIDEQMKAVAAPVVKVAKLGQRYYVEGDKLTILSQTTLTMSQLEEILEQMKSKAIKNLATKK